MNIISLFLDFTDWQIESDKLKLMRSNGQTGIKEQEEKCIKIWEHFKMQCQAFDDALKIALKGK